MSGPCSPHRSGQIQVGCHTGRDRIRSEGVEVTPSPFPHEAEGLRTIRELLPQTSPYRAWSNVEFRDGQGKWHEVDLIVLGQRRLHLVELKYYSGTLRGDDLRWRRDGHRAEDSPLKLAHRKAQRLASKLRDELLRWAEETGAQIDDIRRVVPFVQESAFLHHPGLRCLLPAASQVDLFGLDGNEHGSGLPGISSRLLEPPTVTDVVGANREEILALLMGRIGLVQRRQREVGSWVIDEPLAEATAGRTGRPPTGTSEPTARRHRAGRRGAGQRPARRRAPARGDRPGPAPGRGRAWCGQCRPTRSASCQDAREI